MNGIRKHLKFVPVINYAMLLVLLVNAFKTLTSSNKRRSLLIKLVVISFLIFAILCAGMDESGSQSFFPCSTARRTGNCNNLTILFGSSCT